VNAALHGPGSRIDTPMPLVPSTPIKHAGKVDRGYDFARAHQILSSHLDLEHLGHVARLDVDNSLRSVT